MESHEYTEAERTGLGLLGCTMVFLGGLCLGAGLMFMLDPNTGRSRRAWVGQKATKLANKTKKMVRGRAQDLKNRTFGVVHEARKAVGSVS